MLPDASRLATLLVVAVALIAVPGPSVVFVVSRGVALGRRAALATVAGNEVGLLIQLAAVSLGLGAIVETSIVVYTAIKYVGAAYLVYLGVQAIRHRHQLSASLHDQAARRPRALFAQAVTVGVSNPKGFLIFAAVLPQFIDPGLGRPWLQMVVLGLVCVLVAVVTDSAWALLAGTARDWLARSPRRLAAVGAVSGCVIAGLGVRLALSDRRV